ncbi:MAG TPA: hypothetical protein VFP42_03180 [Acidimicrobiia bacterium]|nr:hypothetical protein [Acidimicrobiia bacterium]
MQPIQRLVVVAVLLISACGQVEPVTVAVSMPDCVYRGADRMRAGDASVSLTLNGIADAGATLVLIEDTHGYSELVEVLHETGQVPTWVESVVELELSPDDGIDGVEETVTLDAGTYALLCVSDDGVRPASSLTVTMG